MTVDAILNPLGELVSLEVREPIFPHRHVTLVATFERGELHLPFTPEQARSLAEGLSEGASEGADALEQNYEGGQN
jgi:hypothetical protein